MPPESKKLPADVPAPTWTCAGCGRRFKIPEGKTARELCANCKRAAAAVKPPETTVDELAALALAEIRKPPPLPAQAIELRRRRKLRLPNRRTWLLMGGGAAAVAISAGIAIGLIARARTWPISDDAALAKCREKVLDVLVAPKTAEFSGSKIERKKLAGGAEVASIEGRVDSKNAAGVPVRARWEAMVRLEAGAKEWRVLYVMLDDKQAYVDAEVKAIAAAEEERKKQEQFAAALKELAENIKRDTARREAAGWTEIAKLTGEFRDFDIPFRTRAQSFRVSFRGVPPVKFHVFDAETGKQIGDAKLFSERQGSFEVLTSPGPKRLEVDSRRWSLTIEE